MFLLQIWIEIIEPPQKMDARIHFHWSQLGLFQYSIPPSVQGRISWGPQPMTRTNQQVPFMTAHKSYFPWKLTACPCKNWCLEDDSFPFEFGFRPTFMGELLVSWRVNMLKFRISALSTGHWPLMQTMGRRRDKALEEGKNCIEWGGNQIQIWPGVKPSKLRSSNHEPFRNTMNPIDNHVGGWTNPFKKYARSSNWISPKIGMKITNILLLPAPSNIQYIYTLIKYVNQDLGIFTVTVLKKDFQLRGLLFWQWTPFTLM